MSNNLACHDMIIISEEGKIMDWASLNREEQGTQVVVENSGMGLEQFHLAHESANNLIGLFFDKGYESDGTQPKIVLLEASSIRVRQSQQVLTLHAKLSLR